MGVRFDELTFFSSELLLAIGILSLPRCRRDGLFSLATPLPVNTFNSRGVGRALIGAPFARGPEKSAIMRVSEPQTPSKKIKPRTLTTQFYWFAAIFGCGLMLISLGTASAQQPLRPELILDVGAPQEVNAQPNFVMAQPLAPFAIPFRSTMGESAYAAAKQQANSAYAPGVTKPFPLAPTPLGPPVIKTNNFNGHSETQGFFPPDTHGAIGVDHFVEVTNSHFDVFSKASPHALLKSVTLATFFNYTVETLFDPRVVYDQTWQRWIVTADAFPESTTVQRLFIGVSKTSDPTGPFFIYNIDVDFFNNNDFYDFPQLGIDQDAVLFTANIFPAAGGFSGADFFSIAKARLYNGLSFSVPIFTGLAATLAPPIVLDQNASTFLIAAPPSGTTLTKFTATNTSHPGSTRLVPSTVTVPFYDVPPNAHQSGTAQVIDTSDSRFVNASTQNGTDLWQTHTINSFWVSLAVFLPYQHRDQRSQAERILPRERDVG